MSFSEIVLREVSAPFLAGAEAYRDIVSPIGLR
jgi:hypothetical protein